MLTGGCELFGDSGAGPDAATGVPCEVAEDCSSPYVCAGGRCQEAEATGLGGACWANRDCEGELYCSAQARCAPAGEGAIGDVCGTGGECTDDLRCDLDGLAGTCRAGGEVDVGGGCEGDAECIPGLVCGPSGACAHPEKAYPPWDGVECAEDDGPFRVHFDPSSTTETEFFRLPFPSDARTANGGLDLSDFPRPGPQALGVDFVDLYAEALAEDFAGFSPTAAITMRLSEPLNEASAGPESIRLVDITTGSDEYGQPRDRRWEFVAARNRYRCQNALIIEPQLSEPLLPGHTYAAYVTTDLESTGGAQATADDAMSAMLADEPPDEALQAAWDAHAPFRDYLEQADAPAEAVAGAAVFTVQDGIAPARALADAVLAEDPPVLSDLTLCGDDVTSPCEGAGRTCGPASEEKLEVHGRLRIPRYQAGQPPFEAPSDGGAIAFEDGQPQKQGDDDVCFALTIPSGQPPEQGFPVVVYAHGTGGSFTSARDQGVAGALARAQAPMATLSYEGVAHGERKRDSTRDPETLMFNVGNPRAARDNHLQGAVDVLQALRVAEQTIEVEGADDIELDADRTFVFGHSQGGNVGVPALAVTALTDTAVISGTGAHLTEALLSKTSPVDSRRGLERLVADELSRTHPVMVLWQTFFDPVDTATFGPALVDRPPDGLPSKNVLMTWGRDDTFSPQPSLAAMARAGGLPVAEPVIEDLDTGSLARPVSENRVGGEGEERTAACFQYDATEFDGHFVSTRDPDAVADWTQFFVTAQDGAPEVGDPGE